MKGKKKEASRLRRKVHRSGRSKKLNLTGEEQGECELPERCEGDSQEFGRK